MTNETPSKIGGIQKGVNAKMESASGVPAKGGAGTPGKISPSYPERSIAFQISKKKFIEAAEACCGRLYPKEIKGTLEVPQIGRIVYNLSLEKLQFDFLPKNPPKLRKYTNAIKMIGSASGEMGPPDIKTKRVFFKVYAVAEPKILDDFVYLQFREFGIENFAPSDRTLSPEVISRVQATMDSLINGQIREKIKDIKLCPTVLPLDKEKLLKIKMNSVKVKENALSLCAVAEADQAVLPSYERAATGFEISPQGDEIHISDDFLSILFTSLWCSGKIPEYKREEKVEIDGFKTHVHVTIHRVRLKIENSHLYVTGRVKVEWGPTAQKSYDFIAPISISIDKATSEITFVIGDPTLKDVKRSDVPDWLWKLIMEILKKILPGWASTLIEVLHIIFQIILEHLKKLATEITEKLELPKGALIFFVPVPDINIVYKFHCTDIKMSENEIILLGWSEIIVGSIVW